MRRVWRGGGGRVSTQIISSVEMCALIELERKHFHEFFFYSLDFGENLNVMISSHLCENKINIFEN